MNFANGAETTLSGSITNASATMNVADASRFPAPPFHVAVDQELMTVTAVAANTFTITRGIEGTTPAAHAIGAVVANTVTAGDFAGFGSGGGGGDMLSPLVNAPNLITNADAGLSYSTWNVVKASTGAHTVTLPIPAAGKLVAVRIDPASTFLVTLSHSSLESIDGQPTRILWAGEKAVLLCDGVNWFKVAGQTIPMACSMHLSADQAGMTPSVVTRINIDAVDSDNTGLMGDGTGHQIVIKRPGSYILLASARSSNPATNSPTWATIVQQNGNAVGQSLCPVSNGGNSSPFIAIPVQLSSGDDITLNAYNGSTNAMSAVGTALVNGPSQLSALEQPAW